MSASRSQSLMRAPVGGLAIIAVATALVGCAPQLTPKQVAEEWVTAVVKGDLPAAQSLTNVPLNERMLTVERLHIIGSREPTEVSGVHVYIVSDPSSIVVESVDLRERSLKPGALAAGGYEVLVSRGRPYFVEGTFGGADGRSGIGQE